MGKNIMKVNGKMENIIIKEQNIMRMGKFFIQVNIMKECLMEME